ncbi:hypothetical protein O9X98_15210 [Agrobacterium salinitolerans]|nr:hypothetical protein [Agrobacterium salinitolerans]
MVKSVSREGLFDLLQCMRPLLEQHILEFQGSTGNVFATRVVTEGFCRGACAGLVFVLALADPAGMWRIVGGCGAECEPLPAVAAKFVNASLFPGGMSDSRGQWRGHFWVEGELDCGTTVIADLTADQFGHAPITVVDGSDQFYRRNLLPRYEPLTKSERKWGHELAGKWLRGLRGEEFRSLAA